ncbi:MAG: PQQ-dependent sugar dehydrogenase, partial [Chloroflexota bacterium]
GEKFIMFKGRSDGKAAFFLQVRTFNDKFWIRGFSLTDARERVATKWVAVPNKYSFIEIDWQTSSGAGLNTGKFRVWVNGKLRRTLSGLDNDTLNIDEAQLGITGRIKYIYTVSGEFSLDEYVSKRKNYIGPVGKLPKPGGFEWVQIASGFTKPVVVDNAGDGSDRLFVVERAGVISVIKNGSILGTPFLDINAKVKSDEGEYGLLGLAFHPNYAANGYFYVNYNNNLNGDTIVERYTVSGNPDIADDLSDFQIISYAQPAPNHNGGALAFGADGYLYISSGDGGDRENGQKKTTLLGKILRLDVDNGSPYGIPANNPYAISGGEPEIWAFGLRNPWRISIDSLTGDLYIGDVGAKTWEEIDYLSASAIGGVNFGWSYREGGHPYLGTPPNLNLLRDPIAEYHHDNGCSVSGGVVYRGATLPTWEGVYLYGDFCSGIIWGLIRDFPYWQSKQLFSTSFKVVAFGVDEAGEIYLVDYQGGIYQLKKK